MARKRTCIMEKYVDDGEYDGSDWISESWDEFLKVDDDIKHLYTDGQFNFGRLKYYVPEKNMYFKKRADIAKYFKVSEGYVTHVLANRYKNPKFHVERTKNE